MANGYIKAAQIIADDQTEVASKLQTLLATEGVDAGEIDQLEITTFGANKFLIAILYATLRTFGDFAKGVGLKASGLALKFAFKRSLVVTAGFKPAFVDKYTYKRALSATIGFATSFVNKLSTKLTSVKIGLTTLTPLWSIPFTNRGLSTTLGFATSLDYTSHDVAQEKELTTLVGLKVAWSVVSNGYPIDV